MTFKIEGEYTTAEVLGPRDAFDAAFIEQVQRMVDHEAFDGPVRMQSDGHAGAGACIGFTMPLGERIVPNTVGVDIGCGVSALNLGSLDIYEEGDEQLLDVLDGEIREHVPMGRQTFADTRVEQDYHVVDDFPWDDCEEKLDRLNENWGGEEIISPAYGKGYLMNLCDRVGYDLTRLIYSIGTLGGGNHFVEICRSEETGDYWVVVHSGSRGIGLSIADHWQEQAHRACDERAEWVRSKLSAYPDEFYKFDIDTVSDRDLLNWVQGGMGEDWKDTDAIREYYLPDSPTSIGKTVDGLKDITEFVVENAGGNDLDYLEGEDRHGYLVDMIFAQTYAEESRRRMVEAVAEVLGKGNQARATEHRINSTHNYIDFEDCVVRKGATRVHEDERAIIPFNMASGSIIVRGKGNESYNRSAPHGAGRRGSRRWAHEQFSMANFEAQMDGVFSTSVVEETLDEHPDAYKSPEMIREHIEETAEIEETLLPVHSLKALE